MSNQVDASHILVKTEHEANEILEKVKGGESFEKLAEEKSECPSGKKG
ncbi:MAG: peptidylprolyl isomerase, partial [Nanoarchaeota archaeon]|nr:peptidylprolyl isomerase [Nanoarchaeota archaeon]